MSPWTHKKSVWACLPWGGEKPGGQTFHRYLTYLHSIICLTRLSVFPVWVDTQGLMFEFCSFVVPHNEYEASGTVGKLSDTPSFISKWRTRQRISKLLSLSSIFLLHTHYTSIEPQYIAPHLFDLESSKTLSYLITRILPCRHWPNPIWGSLSVTTLALPAPMWPIISSIGLTTIPLLPHTPSYLVYRRVRALLVYTRS